MRRILFILSLLLANSVAGFCQDTIQPKMSLAQNAEAFSKGLAEKYNENFDMAIAYFEEALKAFPEDHASMYELSALYSRKGLPEKGFEMIKAAVELDSTNKWYKIRLADFYSQNNDYDSFVNIYDDLLKDEPNNLEYLEVYIDALLHLERYEQVTEKLDVFEDNIGVNEYISLQKLEIYNLLGNKDKVIEEMEKLSKAYPYETRYMSVLAEMYMQDKRDQDALNVYLKIKEINPEDPYINTSLLEYYQKQGELDKAFEEFILAIKNKKLDYNTKAQIYEYWFNLKDDGDNTVKEAEIAGNAFIETHPDKELGYYVIGTVHYNNENYAEAKKYYMDAIARDSSSFISWYQLIFTDLELNDTEGLYEHTMKAQRFYPEQPIFYLFNGVALIEMQKYQEAAKVLEKGRYLSADKKLTVNFDTYLADIYHELGEKDKMYKQYDRVLKNDPENIYVLNNYAYFLSEDNTRLEDALRMSAVTVEKEPKNTTYLDTYAWVLYKLGRYKEAKKWMEKVFSYDKNASGVYYEHYGDILYKFGDTQKAVQNWKKAKKLGETSEFIDQKIRDEKLYE
ncbi:MAG: tetratricopeptide repeat protein [Bacteroidales bacterium]|nr:tetratricopeptide repeat protein [Bacteroidales bacterium]